jgi:Uma2 family endonuclease
MNRNITLPEALPARFALDPKHKLTDDEYFEFCAARPDLRIERTAEGEIVIVPPAGYESSRHETEVVRQLANWAIRDGRGGVSGPSAAFFLSDGSSFSPDAAWLSNEAYSALTRKQRRQFPPVCPEFVVEVMSASDRLRAAKAKMERWTANGAQLGWLIDGDAKTVYIYRPGQPAEKRTGILELAGEGPVESFVLDLGPIWAGA